MGAVAMFRYLILMSSFCTLQLLNLSFSIELKMTICDGEKYYGLKFISKSAWRKKKIKRPHILLTELYIQT